MKTLSKWLTILSRIVGVCALVLATACATGKYMPSKISVALLYLYIALFTLFMEFNIEDNDMNNLCM